jgi:hypothetical protein
MKFWRIPSNKEILKLDNPFEMLLTKDVPFAYKFEISKDGKMNPNFLKNE